MLSHDLLESWTLGGTRATMSYKVINFSANSITGNFDVVDCEHVFIIKFDFMFSVYKLIGKKWLYCIVCFYLKDYWFVLLLHDLGKLYLCRKKSYHVQRQILFFTGSFWSFKKAIIQMDLLLYNLGNIKRSKQCIKIVFWIYWKNIHIYVTLLLLNYYILNVLHHLKHSFFKTTCFCSNPSSPNPVPCGWSQTFGRQLTLFYHFCFISVLAFLTNYLSYNLSSYIIAN